MTTCMKAKSTEARLEAFFVHSRLDVKFVRNGLGLSVVILVKHELEGAVKISGHRLLQQND